MQVTGPGCEKLTEVYLVINGDDLKPRWVPLDKVDKETCTWKKDNLRDTISTSTATFSLRAGPIRFGCQMAVADKKNDPANITFAYSGKGEFRNVSVKVVPPMRVNYLRDVHPFAEDLHPIGCLEFATLDDGEGSINNAKYRGEDVYFDFGPFNPKRQKLGLHLDDIVVADGTQLLTRDGVVYRLTVQRAKGKVRSAPTLSSNAISLDIRKLADLKFERAEFQVVK